MRFSELARRCLKETYRDRLSLGFLLGFPLVFMLLMGVAFAGDTAPEYDLGVLDQDQSQVSQAFVTEALATAFEITSYDDSSQALGDLKAGEISAYITIPQGFGAQVYQNWQGEKENIVLDITYDESDLIVKEQVISMIDAVTRSFARIEVPVTLNASPIHIESEITYIDFIAPGIIIFGLLILIPTSARMMVRDKEKGVLARLLTTPARPWEFISAYSICLFAVGIAQIIIFMVVAVLFGLDIVGSAGLVFLVFTLTALCCIGIGMIISSLTKSENQADPLSWLIAMPLAMLSGCWFSIEFMPSWLQSIANAFPFSHAIEASRSILSRGTGFEAVTSDFLFLVIWTVIVFAAGILLFRRKMPI
ncbi:MAG: ABC transporter permease [Dehalococcoidia bacterium DG_18]|nr:MAG: ABC transporter permease [Dehalococcoidia bacterium DG_18]